MVSTSNEESSSTNSHVYSLSESKNFLIKDLEVKLFSENSSNCFSLQRYPLNYDQFYVFTEDVLQLLTIFTDRCVIDSWQGHKYTSLTCSNPQANTSVIRQKGESQNGCFKESKHVKFSEKTNISYTPRPPWVSGTEIFQGKQTKVLTNINMQVLSERLLSVGQTFQNSQEMHLFCNNNKKNLSPFRDVISMSIRFSFLAQLGSGIFCLLNAFT